MENEDKEVNKEELVESEEQKSEGEAEGVVAEERPERNYKAELARKNAQIEKLRQERESLERNNTQKRDPADLNTWSDHELKAVIKSNDQSVIAYKDQAEEIILERRVRSIREKERQQEKRALSDLELRQKFPEAMDSTSPLALEMEQVMYELDLQKSPAGRLAAAEIANARLGKGRSNKTALERKNESSRTDELKRHMVDGDRSKPTQAKNSPKDIEALEKRIQTEKVTDASGVQEALKLKGMTRESFFGRK